MIRRRSTLHAVSIPAPSVPPPTGNWAGGASQAPLGYESFVHRKPGLLVGLGVGSLTVAGLSILAGLYSMLVLVPMVMMLSMGNQGVATFGPAVASTPANTIASADADSIAAAMAARQPLSPADQALLSQALQLAETPLAPPPDGKWTPAHVSQQVGTTSSWNDGTTTSTTFSFNSGGEITLSGGSADVNLWNANGDYVTTTVANGASSVPTTTTNITYSTFGGFSWASVILSGASTALSLGLAVLLLIAGIQAVRGMPSGRTLHLWYAWPTIGAAILAAFASYYSWGGGFFAMMFAGGGSDNTIALGFALGWLAIGIAWPVVVLIVLRARSIRAYYTEPEAAVIAATAHLPRTWA